MVRFLKIVVVVPVAIALLAFAFANRHFVTVSFDPFPSGDVPLDRAAYGGISASDPFSPLPHEFHGPYLALRITFFYNPATGEMEQYR